MNPPLVIGVGNSDRGDDGAGRAVARLLRRRGVRALEQTGEAATLLEAWRGEDDIVVVDACASGRPPGTIRVFDARREPLPSHLRSSSTHGWGAAWAVEMARALGELPGRLVVYGIEGAQFEPGQGLSEAVAAAAREVADDLARSAGGSQ
jgi:hydrogenase maturation protease